MVEKKCFNESEDTANGCSINLVPVCVKSPVAKVEVSDRDTKLWGD